MDDTTTTDIENPLREAYLNAPKPAKDYIDSGKFDTFIEFLKSRLALSSEDVGKASNEILLALLGVTDPTTLENSLEHGQLLPATLAAPIAAEAKRLIFDDLLAKAKELGRSAAPAVKPIAPVVPPPINRLMPATPPVVAPKPAPVVVPPPAPVVVTPPAPVAPVKIAPDATPQAPVTPPAVRTPVVAAPPAPVASAPSASPIMKMPTPPIASAPAPLPPLPPLPPIIAPVPTTVIEKKRPAEHASKAPIHPPAAAKADPYRESVE